MERAAIPTDSDLHALPAGLPRPADDGAAAHLRGLPVPRLRLRATSGGEVDLADAASRGCILFLYPATLAPPAVIPGEWSAIPGARGCTIENLGFRAAFPEISELGCEVYGISGQGQLEAEEGLRQQRELRERLRLPFELLNDSAFALGEALRLPTFVARLTEPVVEFEGRRVSFPLQGRRLYTRLTLVAARGRIERVFYPVFPPDLHAEELLEYLRRGGGPGASGVPTGAGGTR